MKPNGGSTGEYGERGSLLDRGIIDSAGAMELVSFIETESEVQLNDQDLMPENLDSIAAITVFVARKLEAQEKPGPAAACCSESR